jgi:hypothetical protein
VTRFDAWWLPGFVPGPDTVYREIAGDGVVARAPRLTVSELEAVTDRLRQSRQEYLRCLPVDQIIQIIGAAIGRWLDPYSPFLHQATNLIPAFTGYPESAVRKGLAGFLGSLRSENLRRLVRDELGDPEILDGFRPRGAAAGLTRAVGPGLVFHSFAGNIPGLPAQSLVMATLAKAASLGKVASEEPIFASLFARSIAAVEPRLGDCLAVTYWPGNDASAGERAFAAADLVVAYGNEATIESVRARVRLGTPLIAYGHKLSFGVVLRERLVASELDDLADRAAYDVARFDQQGCLSPHLFYVEEGGDVTPEDFARALAGALRRWSATVPRGKLTPDERRRSAEVQREHAFRAAVGAAAIYGGAGEEWAVLFDSDPAFIASCLNRTIWVKSLPDVRDLPALVEPFRRFIQTAGLAATDSRLGSASEILADLGADRICPLGQMGDPPVTWHHDGGFNVLGFLRFTDLEPEATGGRWEFAHPSAGVLGVERRSNTRSGG